MPNHYMPSGDHGGCQSESFTGVCHYNDVPGQITECDFKSSDGDGFCARVSGLNLRTPHSHWLPMRDGEIYNCFYMHRDNRVCLLLSDICSQKNSFGQCIYVGGRKSIDYFEGTIVNGHIDCCHNGQDFRCQCSSHCGSKNFDGLCTRGLPVSLNTRALDLAALQSRPYVVPSISSYQPETGDQLQQMFHELVSSPTDSERRQRGTQRAVDRIAAANTPLPKIECRDTDCKWNNKNVCFSVRAIMDQEHRCQCFEPKDPGADKEYTSPISNIEL